MIYVSAQIDATGSAFEAFLGWNYYSGAIVGFLLYGIAGQIFPAHSQVFPSNFVNSTRRF